jgi:D-sedoheptulose 7-phosphate isomerase
MTPSDINQYFATLAAAPAGAQVTDRAGATVALAEFYRRVIDWCRTAHDQGNTIHFVGNGGSAAIASHMATDFCKNGGMRARAHNDVSMLTCYANDYSYEEVFSRQLATHAQAGDVVIVISSSGKSKNMLNAVSAARAARCRVVTLSGFGADNPLRLMGDLNAYVRASEYGFVEIAHLALCHAMVDLANGWVAHGPQQQTSQTITQRPVEPVRLAVGA